MKNKILTGVLVVISVTALARCGGSGGQPLASKNVSTVLGQLNTQLGRLPKSNTAVTLPMSGATTSATSARGFLATTTCESVSPATPVDADADSIALTKTSTFNCTDFTSGGNKYTRVGSYKVQDKNDALAGMVGGIRVEFDLSKYNYTDLSSNAVSSGSYSGYWEYEQNGGKLISTSDFSGHNGYSSPTSTVETDYDYTYSWDWVMTPDNSGAPFTTGQQDFEGKFTMSGKFDLEDSHGAHSQGNGTFQIKYYSSNLRYDSGCTKWYKSGSIVIDDYNGSTFEIRYSCSTAKLYVNGKASDLWAP